MTNNTTVGDLTNALFGGAGLTITSASLSSQSNDIGQANTGLYTLTPGGNSYNLTSNGVVLSTGNAADYGTGLNTTTGKSTAFGVAATDAQEALLKPVSGSTTYNHYDVAQLTVNFTLAPTSDRVFFNVTFGSEEFPVFVNSGFIDAFGLYADGVNIATVGGLPVNINNPSFAAIAGTELNGVLAPGGDPKLLFSKVYGFGASGSLTFIVGDTSDSAFDTTVYLSSLTGGDATGPPNAVPAPAGIVAFGLGLVGLVGRRFRRHAAA